MRPMPELRVKRMPTKDLIPYANNARIHSAEQIDTITASIEQFGFNDPVGVWENDKGGLEIVEGHGRVLAAQKLGIDKVPVVRLDHLTDEQRRAYSIVHNQTTDNSTFDEDILKIELDDLDFEWEDFGIELQDFELGEVMDDMYSGEVGTVTYEPKDTNHKPKDLYSFGRQDLDALIEKVEDKELKKMLELRKAWFTDFNFAKIADYYAYQATPDEQRVFEAMGLVLLDKDGLMENGFADLVDGV